MNRVTGREQTLPFCHFYCFSCTEILGKRKICNLEAKILMRQEPANDPKALVRLAGGLVEWLGGNPPKQARVDQEAADSPGNAISRRSLALLGHHHHHCHHHHCHHHHCHFDLHELIVNNIPIQTSIFILSLALPGAQYIGSVPIRLSMWRLGQNLQYLFI